MFGMEAARSGFEQMGLRAGGARRKKLPPRAPFYAVRPGPAPWTARASCRRARIAMCEHVAPHQGLARKKMRVAPIPFQRQWGIVSLDGAGVARDRRVCFRSSMSCGASTHRKENYGYCQERRKEAREEIREEA